MIIITPLPRTKFPGDKAQYLISLPYKLKMFSICDITNEEETLHICQMPWQNA